MITLSFKIMRYNYFVNAFIPFVTTTANAARFGLTTVQVAALTGFLSDWNTKMLAYVNPVTNGHLTVDAINAAYQNGFTLTQSIRGIIKRNTTITLTSEERLVLGLKRGDTTHTPAGIPKSAPAITCILQSSMNMTLVAIFPENPFKRAKPPGVAAIGFKTAIIKAGDPPPTLADYVRQEDETTSVFEMLFTAAQVGKTLYIIGFYINARNEAGADGLPYSVTII